MTKTWWLPMLLALSLVAASGCTRIAEMRHGIRIEGIRLTASGYMLDLRYKVVDVERATALLTEGKRPRLTDEATGATFAVPDMPKVGMLKTSARGHNLREGMTGFVLFANPAQFVKAGAKVTVAIGDLQVKHLVVQ